MKKKTSLMAMLLAALIFALMALGCNSTSSSSSSSNNKSYGGYSKEYWDSARAGWEAGLNS